VNGVGAGKGMLYTDGELSNVYTKEHEKHPFHLVDPSPWPILTSFSAFLVVLSLAAWMHGTAVNVVL
jgi:cytochrome c oxidase subunit 3